MTSAEPWMPSADDWKRAFGSRRSQQPDQAGGFAICIPIFPATLAVGRELVESRIGGGSEVDVAVHDDGRGVDHADRSLEPFAGNRHFSTSFPALALPMRRLGRIVAGADHVPVVHGPVTRIVLGMRGSSQSKRPECGRQRDEVDRFHNWSCNMNWSGDNVICSCPLGANSTTNIFAAPANYLQPQALLAFVAGGGSIECCFS